MQVRLPFSDSSATGSIVGRIPSRLSLLGKAGAAFHRLGRATHAIELGLQVLQRCEVNRRDGGGLQHRFGAGLGTRGTQQQAINSFVQKSIESGCVAALVREAETQRLLS